MTRVSVCLLVFACGADPSSGDDDESVNCAIETRDDDFLIGIEKAGQLFQFQLLSATPAPPARGDNTWQLQLLDANGPVSGATIVVAPFMPDHQHGTAIPTIVEPLSSPGQYELSPINMWMPALWETTIQATVGSDSDRVVFRFCIPS